jgi:hypothetical protein
MSPEQLAKSGTEHGEQAALFCWCAMAERRGFAAADDAECYKSFDYAEATYGTQDGVTELRWYHAIPNGGSRGDTAMSARIAGGKMKAEGVKSGVSDTFLPVRRGTWGGLYIEMKKPALRPKKPGGKGGASDEQLAFGEFVQAQGFGFVICYSWRDAANVLKEYLNYGRSE